MSKTPLVIIGALMACAGAIAAPAGWPLAARTDRASAAEARPAAAFALRTASDLDDLMHKVLAQRDENWKKLQQYILDEREQIEIRLGGQTPIWGDRREYSWFIKDGYFIRSPTKVNGVVIPDADRRKAEADYLQRAKNRDKDRGRAQRAGGDGADATAAAGAGAGGAGAGAAASPDTPVTPTRPEPDSQTFDGFLKQSRQPEFIESAYFLRFKFEEGKYAFVGREKFDGQDVLRIEYYPARLFTTEEDRQKRRQSKGETNREKDIDAALEKMMNKVSLVTLWVEPKANQIVKYTFDNVNFDFLPAAWLVRVSDLKASMTMSQAFKDVWLPRDVDMYGAAMLAVGSFDLHYHLDYVDYKQATTGGRIKGIGGGW